jgi:cysteinyl-tRNA synthetase
LFDGVRIINSIKAGTENISEKDLQEFKSFYNLVVFEILGLKEEKASESNDNEILSGAVDLLITLRQQAKTNKDWATADKIRNDLNAIGIELKDGKDGVEWKASPQPSPKERE